LRPREELFYYPLAAAVGVVAFIASTPLLLMLFRNVRNASSRAPNSSTRGAADE